MNGLLLRWASASVPALFLTLFIFLCLAWMTQSPTRVEKQPIVDLLDIAMPLAREQAPQKRQQLPEENTPPATPPMPSLDLDSLRGAQANLWIPPASENNLNPELRLDLDPSLNALDGLNLSDDFSLDMPVNGNPTVLQRSPPNYPSKALRRRLEGFVVVEFIVSREGFVLQDSLKIVESSPPQVFDSAVLRSLRRWRFEPLLIEGEARKYRARQKVDFKLNS